jgi:hypothetical protein
MAKKKNVTLPMEATRDFTLTLEPVTGSLTMFYAFVNGIKVIQSDGTKKRTWTGKIPQHKFVLKSGLLELTTLHSNSVLTCQERQTTKV